MGNHYHEGAYDCPSCGAYALHGCQNEACPGKRQRDNNDLAKSVKEALAEAREAKIKLKKEAEERSRALLLLTAREFISHLPKLIREHKTEDYVLFQHPLSNAKIPVPKDLYTEQPSELATLVITLCADLGTDEVKPESIYEPHESAYREGTYYLGVRLV